MNAITQNKGHRYARLFFYILLAVLTVLFAFPFYWMIVQGSHTSKDIMNIPPPMTFGSSFAENYRVVLDVVPFWRNFVNSLLVASVATILSLLFCSMGGFAFAMYEFPGKRLIFALMMLTMMLPWIVSIIPWFVIVSRLRWVDKYAALIVPGAVNAFGIFWMRQYIEANSPRELLGAARIDGCPEGLILFRIYMPILTPALGSLGILNFLNHWNSFFYPMVVMQTKTMFTLPLALRYLSADPHKGMDYGVVMAAASLVVVPIIIVFWIASRQFISGLTAGAVKG